MPHSLPVPHNLTAALDGALQRAVTVPSATVHAHVARVRRRHPEASPAQVVALLEREYLLLLQGAGAAVGAAAATPAVGTGVALALTVGDAASFLGVSAAFTLAVASVHGIEVEDDERRRALLLASLLGESGARAVEDATATGTLHVARALLTRVPTGTVRRVNRTLTRRLLRHQLVRHTGVGLGRLAPFGIGAAVGVWGARALGRTVVAGARAAFGPPPATFADHPVRSPAPALPAPTLGSTTPPRRGAR